jgi:hypothetical protein
MQAVQGDRKRVLKRMFGCKRQELPVVEKNSVIGHENIEWTHVTPNRNR